MALEDDYHFDSKSLSFFYQCQHLLKRTIKLKLLSTCLQSFCFVLFC